MAETKLRELDIPFHMHVLMQVVVCWFMLHWRLMRPVVNIPALIQAIVWCRTCSKPIAMMTHSNDAHMRHHASMRKVIAFHLVCLFVIEKIKPSEIRALNRPDGRCFVCCWRASTVNNHVHIYTKKYSYVRSREPVNCTALLVMIECGQE